MREMRLWDLLHAANVSLYQYEWWRRKRLLLPAVKRGRYSCYGPSHLERLIAVRELCDANRTLDDIHDHLMPAADE